jgi:hypothetical protein
MLLKFTHRNSGNFPKFARKPRFRHTFQRCPTVRHEAAPRRIHIASSIAVVSSIISSLARQPACFEAMPARSQNLRVFALITSVN